MYSILLSRFLSFSSFLDRNINHALSPKSFGMSFSVLALIFAVLFRCGAVSDPTSDSIFAYLIPVALSSLQIVQQRVHPGNNFFSQNLNLISIQYDDATLSSMKVAIESLVHRCPLTLQLSLISELLRAFPKINLKQSQLPPDYICNRLLGISKFVLDILNTFIVSTDNNLRPLFCCMSEREIQGLTDLIVSVAEFYESISSQFPQIASSNISTQLDNLLNLYSSFASTALLQEGNYLALSAAHSITR